MENQSNLANWSKLEAYFWAKYFGVGQNGVKCCTFSATVILSLTVTLYDGSNAIQSSEATNNNEDIPLFTLYVCMYAIIFWSLKYKYFYEWENVILIICMFDDQRIHVKCI